MHKSISEVNLYYLVMYQNTNEVLSWYGTG